MDDLILCKPCANGAYFKEAKEITWENMNWAPVQGNNKKEQGSNSLGDCPSPPDSY